jgi:uncharacterized membrane protein
VPLTLQVILAVLAHNLGSILLIGSLVFLQAAYLPAVAEVSGSSVRMSLRMDVLACCFRWVWVGIALIYLSGGWAVVAWLDLLSLPIHIAWTLGLSLLLLALLVWAHIGLYWSAEYAMKEQRIKSARRTFGRLNWVLRAALLVALINLLLGASGAVLVG